MFFVYGKLFKFEEIFKTYFARYNLPSSFDRSHHVLTRCLDICFVGLTKKCRFNDLSTSFWIFVKGLVVSNPYIWNCMHFWMQAIFGTISSLMKTCENHYIMGQILSLGWYLASLNTNTTSKSTPGAPSAKGDCYACPLLEFRGFLTLNGCKQTTRGVSRSLSVIVT